MKKIFLIFCLLCSFNASAIDIGYEDFNPDTDSFQTVDEILFHATDETPCATAAFANGLAKTADKVSENDDQSVIQQWINEVFASEDVLTNVLACPELKNFDDADDIRFLPITYKFPMGREISINYQTQPRVLKQRLAIAQRPNVAKLNDPNPRIGALNDNAIWTNTNPSWYAIMVAEHGALDQFVGEGKNNTISLEYIYDHISEMYPRGYTCTNRSAYAHDHYAINDAAKKTAGDTDEKNDFYIAGDINLEWIMYAEIIGDIVISVATMGSGTALMGTMKGLRAGKTLKGLKQTAKALLKSDDVLKWVKLSDKMEHITAKTAKLSEKYGRRVVDDFIDISRKLQKSPTDPKLLKRMEDLKKANPKLASEVTEDMIKGTDDIAKAMKDLEKVDDVKKYKDVRTAYKEMDTLVKTLRGIKLPQRGNVIARPIKTTYKAVKAAWGNGKKIDKAAKLVKHSNLSGRVRDWLAHSTMRNLGAIGKFTAGTGFVYSVINFAGEMYDKTDTSTGEFTNNVQMHPYLLLSADDIPGQDNVINYGMWLMWMGDSFDSADDDAAYLQAMDFAQKFHEDLMERQNNTNSPCNVDIYVVHPVLRNPDSDNAQLFYLIMNDTPWTTAE